MLTVVVHKNLAGAEGYFSEHLAQNDYYAGEVRPGEWMGMGSRRLGLVREVTRDDFVALCENRDPSSGARLTQRQKAEGERRVFYDFTCSAPKSVSILAVTLQDARLVAAHEEAANVAFTELEHFAASRVRRTEVSSDRTTGNVVAARFLHTSSRALDPQLHTHFTVFNATWDSTEARWKALQAGPMYAAIRYATQVYRNELARLVRAIGYRTVPVRDWFEIEGVGEELIQRFSKRSAERDRVVNAMEAHLGRELSKDEVSFAVHRSRARKLTGISTAEVRARQWGELSPSERDSLVRLRDAGPPRQVVEPAAEETALGHAVSHLFERKSVVPEHELLEVALGHRHGAIDLVRLKEVLRTSPDLIATDHGLCTREILRQELRLIEWVRDGKASVPPLRLGFIAAAWLGGDQKAALHHVLLSCDRITGIRGLAGTGKTTVLRELARACREAGTTLRFCAPTAAATEVLRAEGFDAVTLARLLQAAPDSGRVVTVLDEAGAVGTADMLRLLQSPGRVILCGDTGQHGPVPRGDALRIIEDYSPYTFGALTDIRRQRPADYRHAVSLAAHGDMEAALDRLQRMGAVRELPLDHLYAEVAAQYLAALEQGRSTLAVAPTWREIESVTEKVREGLRAQGVLRGPDHEVEVDDSLSWTVAQKSDRSRYRPGHRVRFHHAQGEFARQETVEIVSVGEKLVARRADGSLVTLDPAQAAACVDVGQKRRLKVASGDRLLLQANARGLTNGELVEVARIAGDRIHLADGRVLEKDFRTFTHGYAVTSHAAQGKTVEEVLVVASSRSLGAIHREQFYVSISRARERCQVFTDDRDLLRHHILRSSHRRAAVETVKLSAAHRETLLRRALEIARQVPLRLRQWIRASRPVRRPRSIRTIQQQTASIRV